MDPGRIMIVSDANNINCVPVVAPEPGTVHVAARVCRPAC